MKLKKISRKAIIILVVAAIGITTASYFGITKAGDSDVSETIRREYPVKRADITAGVSAQGVLHYEAESQNFSEAVTIGELFVKAGQNVNAGDKIAMADDKKLNDALEAAQNELEKARIALKQAKNAKTLGALNAQKEAASQGEGSAEAEGNLAQAKASADALRQKIDDLQSQLTQIDAQLAALVEGDPQYAELTARKTALQKELSDTQSALENANSNVSSLEDAKNKQDSARAKSNSIDQKIADANAGNQNDAITLAKLDVETAQKKVDQLQTIKDDPYLYASISGVILSLDASEGSETKPDTPVARIGDPNKKTVSVSVPQSDIGKIKEGQDVEFTLDAFGDTKFTGKVRSRSLVPLKDSNPVSYSVVIEVTPNDTEMLDGMSANATMIIKQQKNVLQLSNKAISVKDGKQVVKMKNEDGTLREMEITTGFSDGKVSEITDGLSEGDVVIVEG